MPLEPTPEPGSMPPPATTTHTSSRRSSYQPFPPISPGVPPTENNMPHRLPRALTAAELHSELEQEQEAMVNRLTRELSALRAHSASVASTTSSTSNAPPFLLDPADASSHIQPLPLATGPTHPSGSRRNRSTSNASSTFMPHAGRSASTSLSVSAVPATPRIEDLALQRQEMEEAKMENERLKKKIIELEAQLKENKAKEGSTDT
ncbi:hypothetical protein BT63DRAFT_442972 [Microthyrium microscopicum]|uniref:Uncharacterized protein n=1 Tax=Microthyrium microscopicum TaxID=703497 RepID=A0A6A6U1U3_9PEZI|nr:hypothetical protein BT63DRAFT_442972 [Microthyrium microscopicum]